MAQLCERVVAALKAEAHQKGPNILSLPEYFKDYRSEMGRKLYGKGGYDIERGDNEKRTQATLRNYEFFGAPSAGVVTMHSDLKAVDSMSVRMFMQTFMLALTDRGLGSCLQISVTGYPDILGKEFKIPDNQKILCGIAIGYPAKNNRVNDLIMSHDDVDNHVTIHRD